jgi:uncharacterized membrane protein YphA (DoxX/SURF4 family)
MEHLILSKISIYLVGSIDIINLLNRWCVWLKSPIDSRTNCQRGGHAQADAVMGRCATMKIVDWTYRLCRWIIAAIFLYAGSAKLMEPAIFATLIEAFGLLSDHLVMPLAIGLPVLEIVAGLGLFFDIRGFLSVVTVLLVLFIAVLAYGLRMGLDVDCGCFGPKDPEAEAFHGLGVSFYRDLLMLAGVGYMYGWRSYRKSTMYNKWMVSKQEG